MVNTNLEFYKTLTDYLQRFSDISLKTAGATAHQIKASQTYWNGILRYMNQFSEPLMISMKSFSAEEKEKLSSQISLEDVSAYTELLKLNLKLAEKAALGAIVPMSAYHSRKATEGFSAWLNTVFDREGEGIDEFMENKFKSLEALVYSYPKIIREIEPDYGFHFDRPGYELIAETDRFLLYQVFHFDKKIKVRKNGKPIIIIPPYVLGANILGFLPGENKSYVHAFANQGIPTYIRIVKDIDITPAVQTMTAEDDALDTRLFCEKVKQKDGQEVTLNGFCQGGFVALTNILSGKLDGLVDALITCVAPMDGTKSIALIQYLEEIPERFRGLGYATKTLENGNRVVDGKVMSIVYKLKSLENEAPVVSFYRDLMMFDRPDGREPKISKTAAAINYWLMYDRVDLPEDIIKQSFYSYTIPVKKDGALPVQLFGKKLNFKRMKEKGVKFLICYAEKDDLVDKASALAPLEFIDAEVTPFPKGHGSIATSWSLPASEYALHTCFGDNYRGPVRYQLDLEKDLSAKEG